VRLNKNLIFLASLKAAREAEVRESRERFAKKMSFFCFFSYDKEKKK